MMYKRYKLEDICTKITDGSHYSPKAVDTGYPMFSVKDMLEYEFSYKDCKRVSEEDYKKLKANGCVPQIGDVLVAKDGSYLKEIFVCREKKEEAILSSIAIFRPDPQKVTSDFLCYLLKSPKVYNYIKNNCVSGSALPRIVLKEFKTVEIDVPNISIQDRIASILKRIDEKIILNNQINDNLLQQAKTLFKSWFVDFDPFDEPMIEAPTGYQIPQSLKMVQIQDLPHILETGKRPKGGAVSEGIPSVGAENVKELGVFDSSSAKFIPHEFAMSMKKGKIEGYELLLYKDGGKPGTFTPHFSMFGEGFPYEEFYINEHVFKLDFNDRGYNEFAYLYMQTDYPYHWLANNGGKAAIPGINQQNVNEIWIYHPSHPRVQEFCKWVQPLFTTIFSNCAQNMKLSKLRDTLLPKLMSGEIDISSIDI